MTENHRSIIKMLLTLMVAVLVLPACNMFREKPPEYLESREGKTLEIPAGLDAPKTANSVLIRVNPMPLPSNDELNPLPPRVAVTAGRGDANAFMAWSSTGAYLAVRDSRESVARRMRFAIERNGMNLVERSDEGGHRFEYQHPRVAQQKGFFKKLMFWRTDYGPNYSGAYQLRLEEDGDLTRVYLQGADGQLVPSNAAEHVLSLFMERLG